MTSRQVQLVGARGCTKRYEKEKSHPHHFENGDFFHHENYLNSTRWQHHFSNLHPRTIAQYRIEEGRHSFSRFPEFEYGECGEYETQQIEPDNGGGEEGVK